MKKILAVIAAGLFVMGLSSCDNKTKEKVVNGGVISATSGGGSAFSSMPAATAASVSTTGMGYTTSMLSSVLGNLSTRAPGLRRSQSTYNLENNFKVNADGWMEYSWTATTWSYLWKYRLLNAAGTPITGTTEDEWWGTKSAVKKYEYLYRGSYDNSADTSASSSEYGEYLPVKYAYTGEGNFVYTTNASSFGGTENATFSFLVEMKNGAKASYTSTISNLVITSTGYYNWKITGGTISSSYDGWRFLITYKSDGTATGTLDGPNYHATIAIDANGSVSYTSQGITKVVTLQK